VEGGLHEGRGAAAWTDGVLTGRDGLLAELVGAAASARAGSGSVVLITGEAGIGKTSLVRVVARRVRHELAVSWGAGAPDSSAPPLWPWRDAIVTAEPTAGEPSAAPAGADSTIGAERYERLRDLRAGLFERARTTALLHVIEDLQWADVASVLLLAHVAGAVADAPVLVLATLRTGEPLAAPLADAIEQVTRSARPCPVPPLSSDDVAKVLRDAGVDGPPDLALQLLDRTGGNPLYVTELVRSLAPGGSGRRRQLVLDRVPPRITGLVAQRLARLPPAVGETVLAAAVMGTEGDTRSLAAVRRIEIPTALELVEQARAAHLFDAAPPGRWRFRHDLVRDAVYGTGTDTQRALLHSAVVDVLAAEHAPAATLARHALAGQPLFDGERAVALAARAGESAFAGHGYEEAVTWFRRALEAAPPDLASRWRAELLVQCGEALRHAGDMEEARRKFAAAAELTTDPGLVARAALGYADPGADLGIAYRTLDPETHTLLERAIQAQPPGDSVTRVRLGARLAAELYFSDDPSRARVLAAEALGAATRLGDLRALVAAGAVTHDAYVVGQAPQSDQLEGSAQLLNLARRDRSAGALLTAHRARVIDLLAAGDLAATDAEIVAFRRVAEPLAAPAYLWWLALWEAMRALLEGHHAEAEARAFGAFELGRRPFPVLAFTNLSFQLYFLRREQGRLAELEATTRDYAAASADIPAIRVALILLLAEVGKRDEAAALLAALTPADLDRLHDRNWPAAWFQLARATYLVGASALAATLLEPRHRPSERCVMVSLATVCLGATDLGEAWLRHTLGDLDAADERFGTAAATNASIGARAWLAQACVDHARLLVDRGRPGDDVLAAAHLDRSGPVAAELGLAPLVSAIRALRAAGGPNPAANASAPAGAAAGTFRRSGATWELVYAGRRVQVAHGRGLVDLALLLGRPDRAVSVIELTDEPNAAELGARGAMVLDERARREIGARLRELDADVADAEAAGDHERAALKREARQILAETVARDFGLGGRSRRLGDPVERARKTVSTRLRRSIAAIGKVHPELGRHLERSIDTGTWCAYRPAEPVEWSL
jgi:tetratricopeptide (TPR) repeat protein